MIFFKNTISLCFSLSEYMNLPKQNLTTLTRRKKGYTLVELVMAILVSGLILAGLISFVVSMSQEMSLARSKGSMYSDFTDFVMELNRVHGAYPNAQIINNG